MHFFMSHIYQWIWASNSQFATHQKPKNLQTKTIQTLVKYLLQRPLFVLLFLPQAMRRFYRMRVLLALVCDKCARRRPDMAHIGRMDGPTKRLVKKVRQ